MTKTKEKLKPPTKEEIVDNMSSKHGFTKHDCRDFYDAFLEDTREYLASGRPVLLMGIGKIDIRTRKAHLGRDLQTMKNVTVPEREVFFFTPSEKLYRELNGYE